jgi:hypothetical protein
MKTAKLKNEEPHKLKLTWNLFSRAFAKYACVVRAGESEFFNLVLKGVPPGDLMRVLTNIHLLASLTY